MTLGSTATSRFLITRPPQEMNHTTKQDISAHTGARGIAALLVFIGHAGYAEGSSSVLLRSVFESLALHNEAVDLFFVLSGFILAYVYHDRLKSYTDWALFFVARIARIFPLHLLVISSIILANYFGLQVGSTTPLQWIDYVKNGLLLQTWPFISARASINMPSWSVSIEWFLYITAFPVLFFIPKILKPRFLFLTALALMAFASVALFDYRFGQAGFLGRHQCFLRGIAGFSAGYLLHSIYTTRPYASPKLQYFWFSVLSATFVASCFESRAGTLCLLAFPGLALEFARSETGISKLLSWKPVKVLGDASYSIYLLHLPLLNLLNPLRPESPSATEFVLWLMGSMTAVIVTSISSFFLFEMPIRRYCRTLFVPKTMESPCSFSFPDEKK